MREIVMNSSVCVIDASFDTALIHIVEATDQQQKIEIENEFAKLIDCRRVTETVLRVEEVCSPNTKYNFGDAVIEYYPENGYDGQIYANQPRDSQRLKVTMHIHAGTGITFLLGAKTELHIHQTHSNFFIRVK